MAGIGSDGSLDFERQASLLCMPKQRLIIAQNGRENGLKKTVSVKQAAKLRGCSLAAVRQVLIAGRLPSARKRNGRWLIDVSELRRYYDFVDQWRDRQKRVASPQSELSLGEFAE